MSNRLDQEREKRLQPIRIAKAIKGIEEKCGLVVIAVNETTIYFKFNDQVVTYFPYSGWHTGKSIKDGRGWKHLYDQIKKER